MTQIKIILKKGVLTLARLNRHFSTGDYMEHIDPLWEPQDIQRGP